MKLIIFDLDGTLIDSARDIARSVNELLETLGHRAQPLSRIESYIGNGVGTLLARSLPENNPGELAQIREMYLAIYRRHLLDTTRAYVGVEETLKKLSADHSLAVLTNKPRAETRLILDGLGLSRYFCATHGGDSFPRRKPDPMGVEHILDETEATAETTLFVGDSSVDFETAANAGVACCLVSYGIGSEEAKTLPARYRVDRPEELISIVQGDRS